MLNFAARVILALKFYTRLSYSWRLAWIKAKRAHDLDEHADYRHAGTL